MPSECPPSVRRLRPHPLRELGVQAVEDLRRLDPVDDAPDVIAGRVHGGEAPVVRSSVMWLRTEKKERPRAIAHNKEKRQTSEITLAPRDDGWRSDRDSHLLHILHLALQRAVVGNVSTEGSLWTGAVSIIPLKDQKGQGKAEMSMIQNTV